MTFSTKVFYSTLLRTWRWMSNNMSTNYKCQRKFVSSQTAGEHGSALRHVVTVGFTQAGRVVPRYSQSRVGSVHIVSSMMDLTWRWSMRLGGWPCRVWRKETKRGTGRYVPNLQGWLVCTLCWFKRQAVHGSTMNRTVSSKNASFPCFGLPILCESSKCTFVRGYNLAGLNSLTEAELYNALPLSGRPHLIGSCAHYYSNRKWTSGIHMNNKRFVFRSPPQKLNGCEKTAFSTKKPRIMPSDCPANVPDSILQLVHSGGIPFPSPFTEPMI